MDFLTEHGVGAADQLRKKQNEESEGREMLAATRKALAAASTQGRTNEGRRTFQTILTAAAFDGDGPSKVTAKRKAELLGVHPEHFVGANRRVTRLRSDLAPEEALAEGAYWFQPRGKRSDATPPELLELIKRFWHTKEVSRASGNSSNRDMWRPSKRKGEEPHARRQLHVHGGGETAFSKCFEWPDYINFKRIWKSEKGSAHAHIPTKPSRAVFAVSRLELIEPGAETCVYNEARPRDRRDRGRFSRHAWAVFKKFG